jgi:hypothetical protein
MLRLIKELLQYKSRVKWREPTIEKRPQLINLSKMPGL